MADSPGPTEMNQHTELWLDDITLRTSSHPDLTDNTRLVIYLSPGDKDMNTAGLIKRRGKDKWRSALPLVLDCAVPEFELQVVLGSKYEGHTTQLGHLKLQTSRLVAAMLNAFPTRSTSGNAILLHNIDCESSHDAPNLYLTVKTSFTPDTGDFSIYDFTTTYGLDGGLIFSSLDHILAKYLDATRLAQAKKLASKAKRLLKSLTSTKQYHNSAPQQSTALNASGGSALKLTALLHIVYSMMDIFQRYGHVHNIDDAIACGQVLHRLFAFNDPSLLTMYEILDALGVSLHKRYRRLGHVVDLTKAIEHKQFALDLIPVEHPHRYRYLASLGISLHVRYKRVGQMEDLTNGIEHRQSALKLIPAEHPDRYKYLYSLGISLHVRFMRLGQMEDLTKSIECAQSALELLPAQHPDRYKYLGNLGSALHVRFKRLGQMEDLTKSIEYTQSALEHIPAEHPARYMYLNDLGISLHARFMRLGQMEDLTKAIESKQSALDLIPLEHPERYMYLDSLGISLCVRFKRLGQMEDLTKSIEYTQSALQLIPAEHPDRYRYLHSLGFSLHVRFKRLGQMEDLTKSIEYAQSAIENVPLEHPDRTFILHSLGVSLYASYVASGRHEDYNASEKVLKSAVHCQNGTFNDRLDARLYLARNASKKNQQLAVWAWQEALSLIPQISGHALPIETRHQHLVAHKQHLQEAIAFAMDQGNWDIVVQWLEQCRSIVWGALLQLQHPLDVLKATEPNLASQLLSISQELESLFNRDRNVMPTMVTQEDPGFNRRIVLTEQREKLIEQVRSLDGFQDFLTPANILQLKSAAMDGPIVVIFMSNEDSYALAVTEKDVIPTPLPGFPSQFAKNMVKDLVSCKKGRFQVRQDTRPLVRSDDPGKLEWPKILEELWIRVVHPILIELKFQANSQDLPHLWWCPTGSFASLPFHAAGIYKSNSGLGTKVSDFVVSSYSPTITALLHSDRVRSSKKPFNVLAIAQPDGKNPLPHTLSELKAIQQLVGASPYTPLVGDQATPETVLAEMKNASWIHLACHGVQDLKIPTNSALILSDRKLELARIISNRHPNAEFAFLSACQTATGDVELPDEAIHLAAGMMLIGYSGVVATLWAIQDQDGPFIAERVYKELLRDGEPDHTRAAAALQKAAHELRESGADFGRWLPWVHFGR